MADLVVTDLTFTVTREVARLGGTRPYRRLYGTILIPVSGEYPIGGVPISGVTNSATGAVVAANALACPGLSCPTELIDLTVNSNGNAAGLDDALVVLFDRGVSGTRPHKLRILRSGGFTPAGTVAAPTFTGAALAAHRHVLHFQTGAAANAVTTQTDQLRTAGAASDVAGVANSSGEGGIVDVTGGTPAGTNSAPAFTGSAVAAARLTEHTNAAVAEALTVYVTILGY